MKAVIQAGGRGTRVASLTQDKIPKPLLPIHGIPMIKRQIDTLTREGIRDFIIITGYLSEAVEECIGNGKNDGINVRYFREETPLGSGGALLMIADMLGNDDFLLVNGDLVFDFYTERMVSFHREKGAGITLLSHPNSHPYDSDLLNTDDNDRVISIDSKNNKRDYWFANSVNAGIAIVNPRILHNLPLGGKLNFEHDIVKRLIREGAEVYAYKSPEYVHDAGTPERINSAETDIQNGFVSAKNLRNPQKAIFLDRDGTINQDNGLIYKPEQFELVNNAAEAIRMINRSGYLALCVTNQSVVARGMCTEDDVRSIHCKMETLLGQSGAYLDGIAFCPHHPDSGYPEERPEYKIPCDCRKPGTKMIMDFTERYNIDLSKSWIIGDQKLDIMCGKNAGINTCLVGNKALGYKADLQCKDLLEAVRKLLS